jgi:hypothetical protein
VSYSVKCQHSTPPDQHPTQRNNRKKIIKTKSGPLFLAPLSLSPDPPDLLEDGCKSQNLKPNFTRPARPSLALEFMLEFMLEFEPSLAESRPTPIPDHPSITANTGIAPQKVKVKKNR